MALKFAKPGKGKPKSLKQQTQWQLFAALGYTIAIRGYLNCWRGLLVHAIQDTVDRRAALGKVDDALHMSLWVEHELRSNLKRIK